jgi:hypothetical protein
MRTRERHDVELDGRREELPPPEVGDRAGTTELAAPVAAPPTDRSTPPRDREVVDKARWWSPSQLAPLAGGVVLVVFGLVAIIKGGLGGAIDRPFVDVFGFSHTPLLGLFELGAGVILLLIALVPTGRTAAMFFGALVAIGGGLVLANLDWVNAHLTTDTSFGWMLLIVGGGVAILAALLPATQSRRVEYR